MKILIIILIVFLIAIAPLCGGCGTITHGTRQEIPISSNPTGATVFVNNELKGKTPLTVNLKRKTKKYTVVIQKEGFIPYETYLERKISWALEGINTVIDPTFGLITAELIDKPSGGAYRLKPETVHVELKESE